MKIKTTSTERKIKSLYQVNIGCGKSPTPGWKNFDNSPSIKIAQSPLRYRIAKILRFLSKQQVEYIEWLKENKIEYANASKRIPLPDNSVKTVYTSHMFEHLSRNEGIQFLQEVKRVLVDGGVLRISVPDLEIYISTYNKTKNADEFMEGILVSAPPISSLLDKLRLLYSGYRHHQWMYDGHSLSKLIHSQGFRDISIQTGRNTFIENYENLDLNERQINSVYVEAKK